MALKFIPACIPFLQLKNFEAFLFGQINYLLAPDIKVVFGILTMWEGDEKMLVHAFTRSLNERR